MAVSAPSHCALMAPAARQLSDALEQIPLAMPSIPVVHNVDAKQADSVDDLRDKLVRQLCEPVRWTACVAELTRRGMTLQLECGPGKVLSGLLRKIDRSITQAHTESPAAFEAARSEAVDK